MTESDEAALRTALHDKHIAAGAEMVVEDGWLVPARYGDAEAEYEQVRRRAGALDLSDIGRIRVRGDGALEMLEHVCTSDVARQEDDTAAYSLLCNERGGIIDHVLVVRLEGYWLLTCSPPARRRVLEHLSAQAEGFGAKVDDQTTKTSMLSVVGPGAAEILDAVLPQRPSELPRGAAKAGSMLIAKYVAMRTGATRLWSLEVMVPNMLVGRAWDFITRKAGHHAVAPVGRIVRERLRVEAGLARWGRQFTEDAGPVAAGLARAVCWEKDFLGKAAIV
jgi:aminomethyltransferase